MDGGLLTYSAAEITLVQARAGPGYERFEQAETEAAQDLARAFRKLDADRRQRKARRDCGRTGTAGANVPCP